MRMSEECSIADAKYSKTNCEQSTWINAGYQPDELELQIPTEENYTIPRVGLSKSNAISPNEVISEGIPRAHYVSHRNSNSKLHNLNCDTQIEISESTQQKEQQCEDYSLLSFFECYRATQVDNELSVKRKAKGKRIVRTALTFLLVCFFLSFFAAVLIIQSEIQKKKFWCEADGFLIIITTIVFIGLLYFKILKPYCGRSVNKFYKQFYRKTSPHLAIFNKWYFKGIVFAAAIVALVIFLVIDSADDRSRLVSAFGIVVLLLFGFLFSTAPRKVIWRHVIWGMTLQFILGLVILRLPIGKAVFQCLGDKVHTFLKFTDAGSSFVFGKLVSELGIFAFKVLSVILFFSFCIQILYYYGVMQWIVIKLGWLLQMTVGTTACESVNAAANIFLGQTEAPLLIKPYLPYMTRSELHAVMTGGFATIAGSVLAAYISFGVDPAHLLSASVMSAPAALAFSKLFYPEVEVSQTNAEDIKITKGSEANVLHAALEGVTTAIPLVANIAANLLAFIAFIAFVDAILNWSCMLVDVEDGVCSLSNIFGYVFMPLAWVMGVPWKDCYYVGQLIGTKTIVNEFVGYLNLRDYVKKGLISKRSEIIATYALCGFSNISGIGIQTGGLGAMAPERKRDLATIALRAMVAGSVACFLTACVAGTLLTIEDEALSPVNGTATGI